MFDPSYRITRVEGGALVAEHQTIEQVVGLTGLDEADVLWSIEEHSYVETDEYIVIEEGEEE
jgi:hypothetical protein